MLTRREIISGLYGAGRFLLLDPKAVEWFEPGWRAALRSFWVLVVVLPMGIVMNWYSYHPYFPQYNVDTTSYLLATTLVPLPFVGLGLYLTWLASKWEGAAEHFPRLLNATNWYGLLSSFVFLPLFLLSETDWLTHNAREAVATGYFAIGLAYMWFITWRILKVNPFMAAGISMISGIITTPIFDLINLHFFGVSRPFFAQ